MLPTSRVLSSTLRCRKQIMSKINVNTRTIVADTAPIIIPMSDDDVESDKPILESENNTFYFNSVRLGNYTNKMG